MVLRRDYPYILLAVVLAVLAAMSVSAPGESIGTFALLGLAGIGVVMGIVINPSLGGYILLIAVFSNMSSILSNQGFPGIIKPLVAVIFSAIIVRNYYIGQIPLDRPRTRMVEIFMIAYFMAVAASYLVATDRDLTLERIIDLGKDIVIVYCILFCIRKPEEWKRAVLAMILVTAALASLGVFQAVTGNPSDEFFGFARIDTGDRLAGPINEPNMWGQVLIAVLPFVIFNFLRASGNGKLIYAAIFVSIFIVLLNTYSRGGYLAFVIVLILITFFFTKFNIWFISSVAAVALLVLPFIPIRYIERFQTLYTITPANQSGIYEEASFRGRTSEMLTGLTMFEEHPLLGVGAANYPVNYQRYAQIVGLEVRSEQREAHSLYLEVIAETGVLGSLSFMGIIFFLFRALSRARSEIKNTRHFDEWSTYISATQVSLIGYLFAAIFLHGAFIRYFWILVALALALIQVVYEMVNYQKYSERWRASS
jgi:O-antigen ligase